eukprot:7385052-Prymnesium_polylepis.2
MRGARAAHTALSGASRPYSTTMPARSRWKAKTRVRTAPRGPFDPRCSDGAQNASVGRIDRSAVTGDDGA